MTHDKSVSARGGKQVAKCGLVLLSLLFLARPGTGQQVPPLPQAPPILEEIKRDVADIKADIKLLKERLGIPPSIAGASPTIAGPQVVHPVGTVGRTADGTEVVCTPNGWQATTASRSYGISDSPVWPPFATQAPVQPLTTSFGVGGWTGACGPNGCSVQPAGIGHGGLIRRSLGLFR